MREKLVKRWIEVGSPDIDDLGSMIGVGGVDLFRIFAGRKEPDQRTAVLLATLFDLKPEELFDARK